MTSAAQGFELLAGKQIDVVIAGNNAKDMNGIAFLTRSKALYPDTVRLLENDGISSQERTDTLAEAVIFRFLAKPWDQSLQATISEAFQHRDMADESRQLQRNVTSANNELTQLNQQLKKHLAAKETLIQRNETALGVTREILQTLPCPIIGIDTDDMIAFTNEAADALFANGVPLLAAAADKRLPEELCIALKQLPGAPESLIIHGRAYQLRNYGMGSTSCSAGSLLMLIPKEII